MSETLKELRSLDMAFDKAKNAFELTRDTIPLLHDQAYRALVGLQVSFHAGKDTLQDSVNQVMTLRTQLDEKSQQLGSLKSAQTHAQGALEEFIGAHKDEENERFQQTLSQIKRKLEDK